MSSKFLKQHSIFIIAAFFLSFVVMTVGALMIFSLSAYIFSLSIFYIRVLEWVLIFLVLSITLSSLLIHYSDHKAMRAYYTASMIALGVLYHILIFVTPLATLKLVLRFSGHFFDASHYGLLFFLLALLFSAVSVFRALSPVVKRISVQIKDLPLYWENKTIVMISDVHLGPIYRQRFLERTISRINSLKPTMVVIAGDLFDGMEADFFWLHEPFKRLKASQGVYYAIGNHDLYLGLKHIKELFRESDIRVLNNERVERKGLQIIGLNYFKNKSLSLDKMIISRLGYKKEDPSVLLWHEPRHIAAAKAAGIDLMLSGHTHDGQLWPFNFIAKWVYRGYNFGLYQEGDFSLYVSCGLGTWGPPLRNTGRAEIVAIRLEKK